MTYSTVHGVDIEPISIAPALQLPPWKVVMDAEFLVLQHNQMCHLIPFAEDSISLTADGLQGQAQARRLC